MNRLWMNIALRFAGLAWISTLACLHSDGARAEDSIAKAPAWTLRIENGDIYRGEVALPQTRDALGWNCPSFILPLAFPWTEIHSIEKNRTLNGTLPAATDAEGNLFAMEQHSGLALSGDIVAVENGKIRMQIAGMGEQIIPLSEIKNILRIFSASNDPVQVMQAQDWEQVLPAPKNGKATKWFLKAGEISTDTSGTTISQWATIPPLATIDIDVAWEQPTVNWWLTIGEPRRMELQVRKLQTKNLLNITLLVENSRDADVASVQIPFPNEPHLALRLLCDADKGAYVLMMGDQVLGRIKGNPSERIVGRNKFSFTNTALGVLTLRDLRISDRPFAIHEAATELAPGLAEVMTRKRGTFVGSIEPAGDSAEIQIRGANGSTASIPLEEIERIEFPKRASDPSQPARPDLVRVELVNGLRFTSEKVSSLALENADSQLGLAAASGLRLEYPGGGLSLPWDAIDRVSRLRFNPAAPNVTGTSATAANGAAANGAGSAGHSSGNRRLMQLVTEDVVSNGRVDSVFVTDAGVRTLMWLPVSASVAAPIHPAVDGEMEPVASAPPPTDKKNLRAVPAVVIRAENPNPKPEPAPSRDLRADEPSLFLITGDCFPSKVMAAGDEELEFESSLFERTRVPSNQVRSVRVVDYQGTDAMDRATRTRLLTLPRMQRKNPPTHVVVARDGDIVRGRIISFDRDEIRIEVRGEERTLPMKNAAEIIWLEAAPKIPSATSADPGFAPSPKEDAMPSETATGVFQVLLAKGSRVSISPSKVTDEELAGEHPLLGPCALPWEKITRLYLGPRIRAMASQNRFGKWKLSNAPDPKFVTEGTSEQNDAPVDTAQDRMLGKLAPDQDLIKLDGTPFRLADYRGKVVILDFWASWCGPCLQSMPRIHQISREYMDAGVEAVFVNIEESEERIRALLQRLELVPTVAMDADGSFAKQYAVQAIPQTVVIDRDGVVLKIFVGAGDETELELIRLLNELTKN